VTGSKFKGAVGQALDLELLPKLDELAGEAKDRLRARTAVEMPELAARIVAAAARGDAKMCEALQEVPELWLEQERVQVTAAQAEILRATVRGVFAVMFQLLAA